MIDKASRFFIVASGLYLTCSPAWSIDPQIPPVADTTGIGQTLFALLFVVGVLFGLTWVLKKFGIAAKHPMNGFFKILSVANLGTREKIALVEIGETWLVIGMTPSSINTLHSMPKGSIDLPGNVDTARVFAKLLEKVRKPEVSQ